MKKSKTEASNIMPQPKSKPKNITKSKPKNRRHYIYNRDISSTEKYRLTTINGYVGSYSYKGTRIIWKNNGNSIIIFSTAGMITVNSNASYEEITNAYHKVRGETIRYVKSHGKK